MTCNKKALKTLEKFFIEIVKEKPNLQRLNDVIRAIKLKRFKPYHMIELEKSFKAYYNDDLEKCKKIFIEVYNSILRQYEEGY